jgi:uncharacterized spore protein YtfJ
MQDVANAGENIVNQLLDRIKSGDSVDVVYGESRQMGNKTVIPIAVAMYGFGAGAGEGRSPGLGDNGSNAASGGGGGGGAMVRVQPVGVLEISEDQTRMIPVIDWSRVITTALTLGSAWMIVRAIFRRR